MADSNHNRRADYADFSDNDPFAELARIMGQAPQEREPRAAEPRAEAPQVAADDDFAIDLEQELMGELDLSEFDEPRDESGLHPASDWRMPVETVDETPAFSAGDIEVDHSVEDLAASIMDSFEMDEAELHPADEAGEAAPATMLAVRIDEEAVAEAVQEWSSEEDAAHAYNPSVVAQQEWSPEEDAAHAYSPSVAAQEWSPEEDAPHAYSPSVSTVEVSQGDDDAAYEAAASYEAYEQAEGYNEAQLIAEFEDFEVAAEPADAGSMASAVFDDEPYTAQAAPVVAAETSLEDELTALLADDGDAEPVEAADAGWSAAQAAPAQQAWQPAVNTFGRANFASAGSQPRQFEPESVAQPAIEAEPVSFAETPGWDEPEEMEADEADFAPSEAPMMAEAAYVEPDEQASDEDAFTSIFSQALAQDETNDAAGHTASDYDEVLSHFSITTPEEPEEVAPVSASRPDAPAIETIDVAEAAYAMSDDLDIPEFDYEPPVPQAPLYDDLADDFAHAFNAEPETAAVTPAQPVAAGAAWIPATPYAQAAPVAAEQAFDPVDAYGIGEGEWQANAAGLDDDFAFDDDFDQALANSAVAGERAQQGAGRRRGLIIAAALAGVAVFGGLGVLGMSLFGGGSDTPAVVRADTEPMKVRPENPGGTVVPNQNSEAYNRVSGGTASGAPEQESLITTAEEPVDIAAQTAPPALPEGISEDDGEGAFAETDPAATSSAQPKSEDRIEFSEQDPDGVGASGDLIAVAPRKVRTMVVRPDGTMVPREMPVAEEMVAAAPLAPSLGQGSIPTIDQATPLAGQEGGANVDTPATVSVVPSQRREPQAAAPAAPQPVTQTPPATPVSAPAAAATAGTSEWSMQIASQPTAESAQSTYQDLARRYGSILEGRGVSIVKADIAGKGTYYRVRIPSASRDEAINLCTRYKSAGGSCFVSR